MERTGSKREDANKARDKNRPEEPLLDAHQVRFGCVPTCVGLPEAQRSIGINDTKLKNTSE